MSNVKTIAEGGLAAFQAANPGRLQLLVFSAPWCAPCRALAPSVEDLADAYVDQIAVGRICIDDAPGLASTFAVRTVPALVVLRDGREVVRRVGAANRTRLARMLDDVLDRGEAA